MELEVVLAEPDPVVGLTIRLRAVAFAAGFVLWFVLGFVGGGALIHALRAPHHHCEARASCT